MKIALVSPYDYFHPGGVSEHIAHLRAEFVRGGHSATFRSAAVASDRSRQQRSPRASSDRVAWSVDLHAGDLRSLTG